MTDKNTKSRLVIRGDVVTATVLLLNVSMGTSILTMPFVMKQAGFGLGVLLVIVTLAITDYTLKLIVHSGHVTNCYTYQGIISKAYGKTGFVVASISQTVFPILVSVQELIIMGQNASKLVQVIVDEKDVGQFYVREDFLSALILLTLIMPLSLLRDITSLATWSVASIGTVFFTVVIVVIRYSTLNLQPTTDAYKFADGGVQNAIGILNSGFISHYSALIIYNSIREKSERKWSYVVSVTVITVGVLYLTFAMIGYATFTENISSNVLDNYCSADVLIDVGRFLVVIMIALTYPVQIFAVRQAIELSLFANHQPPPLYRHVMITFLLLGTTYAMTVLIHCIDFIASLNGDIAGTLIANILPVLSVLKLQKREIFSRDNIPLLLLFAYGVIVAIGGTTLDIVGVIRGSLCSERAPPDICPNDNTTTAP